LIEKFVPQFTSPLGYCAHASAANASAASRYPGVTSTEEPEVATSEALTFAAPR
jgi:hypothetical protein